MKKIALIFFSLFTILLNISHAQGNDFRVLGVTPDGEEVPLNQEVRVRFSKDVVPLGRMERTEEEVGIKINPKLPCSWRWINSSTLACLLAKKEDMKLATKYQLEIPNTIKDLSGTQLDQNYSFEFSTARPQVKTRYFQGWENPETPNIKIIFDQAVEQDSVEKLLYFIDSYDKEYPVRLNLEASNNTDIDYEAYDDISDNKFLISPKVPLPSDTAFRLALKSGLKGKQGDLAGSENPGIVDFNTFPEPKFLGLKCLSNNSDELFIYSQEQAIDKKCNPLGYFSMIFSSPVSKDAIAKNLKITPDLKLAENQDDPWEGIYYYSPLAYADGSRHEYQTSLPMVYRANQKFVLSATKDNIKDEFSRPLSADLNFEFYTDSRNPRLVNLSHYGVLEKNVDSDFFFYITNLNEIKLNYSIYDASGLSNGKTFSYQPAAVKDLSYIFPLKVKELLSNKSGLLAASYDYQPKLNQPTYLDNEDNRWFVAQVTPYIVQAKIGAFNSLVFVIDAATGKPIADADVSFHVSTYKYFSFDEKALTQAKTNSDGIAILSGTRDFDPDLEYFYKWWDAEKRILSVKVQKGEDIAILPINQNYNVEAVGANNSYVGSYLKNEASTYEAWGATAQGIYRLGDNLEFKLFVRDQNNRSFVLPKHKKYKLEVKDPLDKVVFSKAELELTKFGTYYDQFEIPKSGAVGYYTFTLTSLEKENLVLTPISVLVTDFTPAPFKVVTEVDKKSYNNNEIIKLNSHASLYAGGPYSNAKSKIRAQLVSSVFQPNNTEIDSFVFYSPEEASVYSEDLFSQEGFLNEKGEISREIPIKAKDYLVYANIQLENSVSDDRGKNIASNVQAKYFGRDRYLGILQKDWYLTTGKKNNLKLVVTDQNGKIIEGVNIDLEIILQERVASRVKGAGSAYLTNYEVNPKTIIKQTVVSKSRPIDYEFTLDKAGEYKILASIKDSQGREVKAGTEKWVMGKGNFLWAMGENDSLNIIPEKKSYKLGEKAKFFLQNPYPSSLGLITLERNGVLKNFTREFKDSAEVVEVDITEDLIPGFYLSVTVISPRTDKPLEQGQVDLGKPVFKMGYAAVEVSDDYKRLLIDVKADKESYKPREKVRLEFAVKDNPAWKKKLSAELAVAVVDEAVYDLIHNPQNKYDPYQAFYDLDNLNLENFNILKQLIGRRKFEKKGANVGGSGGAFEARNLFKFVSYWNPAVVLDQKNKGSVEFEVPDNLTNWKVLAFAVDATEHMGLGQTAFKVNQLTEIRQALPNQVVEGDEVLARFTIVNRAEKERLLKVNVTTENAGGAKHSAEILAKPMERNNVEFVIPVTKSGEVIFRVEAGDIQDKDILVSKLNVNKRTSLETVASYGSTEESKVQEELLIPSDIRSDVGGFTMIASPSVVGGLESAFKYLKDYPYICWEQRISKAMMAANFLKLKKYLNGEFVWNEAESLIHKTLTDAVNFQAPNGAMTFWDGKAEHSDLFLSAYTALLFSWLQKHSYLPPRQVEDKLINYLMSALREDVFPAYYNEVMKNTVRALILRVLAEKKLVDNSELLNFQTNLPKMDLFAKANYLQALIAVDLGRDLQNKIIQNVLNYSNETAGQFSFIEDVDLFSFKRILYTPFRTNCSILSMLTDYNEKYVDSDNFIKDIPFKMVRTITQRGKSKKDYWGNTQENLFCGTALVDYSRVYEKNKPNYQFVVSLNQDKIGQGKFEDYKDKSIILERALGKADLGLKTNVTWEKSGNGRLYYSTRLSFSPLEIKNVDTNAGIAVNRKYSILKDGKLQDYIPGAALHRGDLVKVDLNLEVPASRFFVAVNDPLPGGLEAVNRSLATASSFDAELANNKVNKEYNAPEFYHQEMRHDSVRFFADYLDVGKYHLSYVAQVIAEGKFVVLPTLVEEMYDPDVFGKTALFNIEVSK